MSKKVNKKIEESITIGDEKLTLSTSHVAEQASGAVMAQYGETVVLATVVAQPMSKDIGYFPLQVEYQEKLYAGGKIKGSRWVKREGRPTDDEVLTARLIDRFIRPLFPEEYSMMDVQVILTVLSVDLVNSPSNVAAIATSAALAISEIPWEGPIGVTRVGMVEDKYVSNPTEEQMEASKLDLVVSTTDEAIIMIEAGANEVSEKELLGGIEFAQKENKKIIKLVKTLQKKIGKEKSEVEKEKIDAKLKSKIKKDAGGKIEELVKGMADKTYGYGDYDEFKNALIEEFEGEDPQVISKIFEKLFNEYIRDLVLSGKRLDGRKMDELRDLSAEVSFLPRTHGSAIFNRGNTQALTITTLGPTSLEQTIETAEGETNKHYIHHYRMPPYSTGESGRMMLKRREIGHGALAEKALLPVIPSGEEFPYMIQVVTEILSSNGSTSMASTCGSSLSLMDAGVPISSPVAGIAMGLIIEDEKNFKVLTDIVGVEDGGGDMDFKVAGTESGITAIQMDVKSTKLTLNILETALEQAKKARLEILSVMNKAISKPNKLSTYAPKIKVIKIDKEKIGDLIGPGGRIIKGIVEKTGAQVDVNDEGEVNISSENNDSLQEAIKIVEGITTDPESGEIYEGTVKKVQPYGAFVEILPGKEGLVYISDMSEDFVKDPNDLVSEGETVKVRVKEIDKLGRINLSMVMDPSYDQKRRSNSRDNDRGGRDSDRGGRSRGRSYNDNNKRGRNRRNDRKGGGGPHFPASRLIKQKKDNY